MKNRKSGIGCGYCDFDHAQIKPESEPQIEQLAALMKENAKLRILIVGHSDGKGAFDYNLSLSQRRTHAVADALVAAYGIARGRRDDRARHLVQEGRRTRQEPPRGDC